MFASLRLLPRLASVALAPLLLGATGLSNNLEERLLAAHNRERAALGVPPLKWDESLAASATDWAQHLATTNAFYHYRPARGDPDPEGENLWAGTRGSFAPEAMVGAWVAEKRFYRPAPVPAVSTTGRFEDVGHYTQVVWRRTGQVGCALVPGGEEDVLVCRYSEGGNVVGERAF